MNPALSRLGRRIQFDERSRAFPVKDILPSKKPRSYTWLCSKVLDQGASGACTGFSFAHELIAKPQTIAGIDATFATEKIYWEAQRIDPWEGGAYPGANPFYEGSSVLAAVKVLTAAKYYQSYHWAFSLEEMVLAVGYGGPCVIGINWYADMFQTDATGRIKVSGAFVGGHAILVNGVSLPGKYFKLVNSWGTGWGIGGHCTMSFDDMRKLLNEQGEVCCVKRA